MKKLAALLVIIVLACLLGGLYGILHDQISYSISPEYYTKFKFYQFKLVKPGEMSAFAYPRIQVAFVGLMASWWMGIPIGVILGLAGIKSLKGARLIKVILRALFIAIAITFITGLIGFTIGHFIFAQQPRSDFKGWFIPDNLVNFKSFITVGTIHNFSYLGGLLGLIAGVIYTVRQKSKQIDSIT